jgi:hypothetical protein
MGNNWEAEPRPTPKVMLKLTRRPLGHEYPQREELTPKAIGNQMKFSAAQFLSCGTAQSG